MRRWLLLAVALTGAWLGLSGAQLRFHPEPRLLGVFHLVVEGVAEEEGEAVLINAVTGQRWVVALKREGTVLKSPPIKVVRSCDRPESGPKDRTDQEDKGGMLVVEVQKPGELLVAATPLAHGLSAAAKVGPRTGPCTLTLEVRDGEKWKPAEQAKRLRAGEYRLRITYPEADCTCERDPLPGGLKIQMGSDSEDLELLEDGLTSGTFTLTFSTAFRLYEVAPAVVFRLLLLCGKEERVFEYLAERTTVIFSACGQELRMQAQTLSVIMEPGPTLLIPVGCRAKIRLVEPEKPDEVRWWLPGLGWFENTVLEIEVDEARVASLPKYPEAVLTKVFARKGADWGMNQIALSIIDRPKLRFVSAETGEEITDGCPFQQAFRIRVEGLRGWPEPSPTVHVGKLGPNPNERAVKLHLVGVGVYESDPLSPQDWQAKAGEFLWAQLRFPEPIECVISVLLPLR